MYLVEVYEQVKPDLEELEKKGAYLASCGTCGFAAQALFDLGPQSARCLVCTQDQSFVLHTCPDEKCGQRTVLGDLSEGWECQTCKMEISLESVLAIYTEEGQRDEKTRMIDGGNAYCSLCEYLEPTAGTVGEEVFCFSCFEWQNEINQCGWCSELITGEEEDTHWSGCMRCEGKSGWVKDE